MNINSSLAIAGMALAAATVSANERESTTIDIASHRVPVLKGGLYERYRSNPPLSVVQQEAPDVDLGWFKTLTKEKVDIGFENWSPNFYYKDSRITAIFTADIARLRELVPAAVREQVQPLQVWPGRGVVALTAYAYHYCDNDSYNEISLSVVVNKPGSSSFGPFSLLGQARGKDFWGYVLKLPVNTELARVRGVVGYGLPKWLAPIHLRDGGDTIAFELIDPDSGKADLVLEGRKLPGLSNEVELVTNSFVNVGRDGGLNYGYAVSRQLSHAASSDAQAVRLTLGEGSLAAYIKSLKLGKMLRYEYVPEFQGALYAPRPLAELATGD